MTTEELLRKIRTIAKQSEPALYAFDLGQIEALCDLALGQIITPNEVIDGIATYSIKFEQPK